MKAKLPRLEQRRKEGGHRLGDAQQCYVLQVAEASKSRRDLVLKAQSFIGTQSTEASLVEDLHENSLHLRAPEQSKELLAAPESHSDRDRKRRLEDLDLGQVLRLWKAKPNVRRLGEVLQIHQSAAQVLPRRAFLRGKTGQRSLRDLFTSLEPVSSAARPCHCGACVPRAVGSGGCHLIQGQRS